MNHNDFIGHLRFLESQTDIPFFSRTNFFESTLSPSSNQSIPFNKVYQEKLNIKTFLSSIWHLRFIKSFPHQQFEAIETERRTRLPVKLSLAIQHHYSTHITALNKAKFKTKSCVGQIQFTISFPKPIAPSISTCTGINRELRLAHTDHFKINITVYNEHTKIDKVTITSHLDHSSSTSTDLSNVASFLNANNTAYQYWHCSPNTKVNRSISDYSTKATLAILIQLYNCFIWVRCLQRQSNRTRPHQVSLRCCNHLNVCLLQWMTKQRIQIRVQQTMCSNEYLPRSLYVRSLSGVNMRLPHDTQEFFMILGDVLRKESSSHRNNIYDLLFEGKISTSIVCKYVTCSSVREESFNDIQLVVKEWKSIEDSLANFTSNEELLGNDQYQTDLYGKQDAIKRTVFSSFPKRCWFS